MNEITWLGLSWCALPVILVLWIQIRWHQNPVELLYAAGRMVGQLLAVGYVLVLVFSNPSPLWSSLIALGMITLAGWIAIRPIKQHPFFWWTAALSLLVALGLHLFIALELVIGVDDWFEPRTFIPLTGMFAANTMNTLSLAGERFVSEVGNQKTITEARQTAYSAAMIPVINSMFAVGLVALPGMMTGQILSGVSPLIAVRYQIMIMAMILGCSGLGAVMFLWLLGRKEDWVKRFALSGSTSK